MAKEYGTRRTTRQKSSAPQQFLTVLVTFVLGYVTASFFDIKTISEWVNTQVLAQHEAKPEAVKATQQNAQLPPKPKFEFYTLLANEKGEAQAQAKAAATSSNAATVAVVVPAKPAVAIAAAGSVKQPAAVKVVEGKPLAATQGNKESYLVQVASLKVRADAEQMKALLTLKGFHVAVVSVSQAQGIWYRVMIGPYLTRLSAQQAQTTLAKSERLNGMLVKTKV
ncbi:MAG: SPOR domain-containing protein [Legionellales bacterium]